MLAVDFKRNKMGIQMTFAAEPSDLQFVQSLMVPRQVVEAYLMHDINAHSCTHKKHKLGSNFF